MPSTQFLEAFRPYMMGAPQDEAVMIERAPGPGSQQIDIASLMQGPSAAAPRQKRTIGNVLSDIFSNRPDARGVPTGEKLVGLGDAFINAGRLWRGDSPISTVGPMRQERLRMEGVADADEARNVFAELLLNPSPETEAAAARIDPMGVLDFRKQQTEVDNSQAEATRGRVADALAAVAGSEDPAALWSRLAADFDPEVAARIGQMLQTGIPAERLAQAYGFEAPSQGTQPKEMQIESMLRAKDPALADSYLKAIANPDAMTEREAAMLQIALGNFGLAQRTADREDRKLAITEDKAAREKSIGEISPGQKALDQAFAKDYADYAAAGGIADVQKGLGQLQEARAILEGGGITGGPTGYLPTFIRGAVNEPSVAVQETIEEVVQRNLKNILGSQFTQKEGERLIERAYNPRLSEAENIKRLDRLIKQFSNAAQQKESAARYFEENGTLQGWKGTLYSMGDILEDRTAPPPKRASTKAPARTNSSGRTIRGGMVDPRLEAAMRKKGMTP